MSLSDSSHNLYISELMPFWGFNLSSWFNSTPVRNFFSRKTTSHSSSIFTHCYLSSMHLEKAGSLLFKTPHVSYSCTVILLVALFFHFFFLFVCLWIIHYNLLSPLTVLLWNVLICISLVPPAGNSMAQ